MYLLFLILADLQHRYDGVLLELFDFFSMMNATTLIKIYNCGKYVYHARLLYQLMNATTLIGYCFDSFACSSRYSNSNKLLAYFFSEFPDLDRDAK